MNARVLPEGGKKMDPNETIINQSPPEGTPPATPAERQPTPPEQTLPPEPISYTDFSVPEGAEKIDAATHDELTKLGQELKLNQEQVQKFVDLGLKKIGDGQEAIRLEILKKKMQWESEAQKDPEIMGNLDHAKRLVDRFGNEELRKTFDDTGIGNNPEFIRFCINAGRALGEAPFVQAGAKQPQEEGTILGGFAKVYEGKM